MLASSIFAACLLTASTVTGFNFTSPSPGSALNLSASTIDIKWSSDNSQYSQFDLSFQGEGTGGSGFRYTIASNLSVDSGSYTWHPSNISDALDSSKIVLTSGNDYHLQADLHDAGSSAGPVLESGNYAVTGYDHIGAAASLHPHIGAALLTVASISFAFGAW